MRQKKQEKERQGKKLRLTDSPPTCGENLCGVVAVGASAGGLEAFSSFLGHLPKASGLAFILIQHMDPSVPSRLPELLGRTASIPVVEAAEGMRIEPDHAYVIPPGIVMAIRDRTLRLQEQREHPGLYHSIDVFFRSLAEDVKDRAVAVILSGTGTDGVDGARAVKAQQGLILVQDPETAKYDGMPRAALAAGVEDFVLAPEAMPEQLIQYFGQSYSRREEIRAVLQKDDASLRSILSLVRAKTGRDFPGYKAASLTRRIERRMAVDQIETVDSYIRFLQEHSEEVETLVKDLLITVTSFFRDAEAFAALKKALREMLQNKPEGSLVRAWIPGCSTGEEAYSIAMLLIECAGELRRRYDLRVFGTDLNAEAIAVARAGVYPPSIAPSVGPERLDRFFTTVDSSYRTSDNTIAGVVVSFTDIHQVKTAWLYAQSIVDTIREPVLVLDEALRVISAGRAFYETFGVSREETQGRVVYELGNRQWDIPPLRDLLRNIQEKDSEFQGYRVEHDFPGVGHRTMLLNARRVSDEAGLTQRILLALEDVTDRPGLEPFSAGEGRRQGESS